MAIQKEASAPAGFLHKAGPPEIFQVHMTVNIMCSCGSKKPIMVHYAPGLPLQAQCDECRMRFAIVRANLSENNPQGIQVGIAYFEPQIVIPKVQM